MSKLIYRTNSKICIYATDSFHEHMGISETVIQMALNDSQDAITDCVNKGIDCVVTKEYDFIVGVTHCIEVPLGSKDVYFKPRGNRPYLSRMIKGALPQPTKSITLILRKTGPWSMTIITSWTGSPARPELGNITYFEKVENPLEEIQESAKFWTTHALIEEEPTPKELYDDMVILCNRLNMDIENISYENLLTILNARLGQEIPSDIPPPECNTEESLMVWLQTHILPLYHK